MQRTTCAVTPSTLWTLAAQRLRGALWRQPAHSWVASSWNPAPTRPPCLPAAPSPSPSWASNGEAAGAAVQASCLFIVQCPELQQCLAIDHASCCYAAVHMGLYTALLKSLVQFCPVGLACLLVPLSYRGLHVTGRFVNAYFSKRQLIVSENFNSVLDG